MNTYLFLHILSLFYLITGKPEPPMKEYPDLSGIDSKSYLTTVRESFTF